MAAAGSEVQPDISMCLVGGRGGRPDSILHSFCYSALLGAEARSVLNAELTHDRLVIQPMAALPQETSAIGGHFFAC